MKGYIITLNRNEEMPNRAYGFIKDLNTNEEYHFDNRDLINCSISQVDTYDTVEYEIGTNKKGRKKAIKVRKVQKDLTSKAVVEPGIKGSILLKSFRDSELEILKFLGTIFFITYSGETKIGNSYYRYCLAKPTERFQNIFNLKRELVVLFSDYLNAEPRDLDAAPKIFKQFDSKLRIDKGCYILVSSDDDIEKLLAEMVTESNYTQIIVPFSYKELLSDETRSFMLVENRFKKYFFDVDLFAESAPIRNEHFFFGRRDYLVDIVTKCRDGKHCGIFGLRRSGKTSMLYAVQNALNNQEYHCIYIPCESDLRNLNWRRALCKIVLNVYRYFNISTEGILESEYDTDDAYTFFEEDMDIVVNSLSKPLTLMFDEIEAISFGVIDDPNNMNKWNDTNNYENFWNCIKGYYSKGNHKLSILVAGTNPSINDEPTISGGNVMNPMFKQLSAANSGYYLPTFRVTDTAAMTNTLGGYMGLKFDDYTNAKLTSDCGGHPYLTRMLCSYINKYVRNQDFDRPYIVTQAIYDVVAKEFEKSAEAENFYLMILNILTTKYQREFNVLRTLALEGESAIIGTEDRASLEHLIGYGLIDNNSGPYAIKSSFIENYLKGKYIFERPNRSVEGQRSEIEQRLSSAEIQLRKIIRQYLRSVYGMELAKEKVLDSMRVNGGCSSYVPIAQTISYKQLFDPSVNIKAYFSLLKDIILNNFEVFSDIEGFDSKEEVGYHFRVLNDARKCFAHFYDEDSVNWSYEKFEEFRSSMTWLENALKDAE